jgi:hypothetical protein
VSLLNVPFDPVFGEDFRGDVWFDVYGKKVDVMVFPCRGLGG